MIDEVGLRGVNEAADETASMKRGIDRILIC